MTEPRSLEAIALELEEIEGSPANLDDPEADYEDRFERREELLREALALGPRAVEPALRRLIAIRARPEGTDEQRAFLARVAASQEDDEARRVLGARLRDLEPGELKLVLAAMPAGGASRDAIGGWFVRQSEFARTTGGGPVAARALLLGAYLLRTPEPGAEDAVLRAALEDPDPAIRKRAAER